jgi:hypothetical protein
MRPVAWVLTGALAACASNPPAHDWQMNAKESSERAAAYLVGPAKGRKPA